MTFPIFAKFLALGIILLIPYAGFSDSNSAAEIPAIFPLAKGNYWIYQGETRWTLSNSNTVFADNLTWKMEVVDSIRNGNVFAAVLKGHPLDLAWYEKGKERGDYVIVAVGSNKFYLYSFASEKILKSIRNGDSNLEASVTQDYALILDFPMNLLNRFGEPFAVTRQDASYCWIVENVSRIKLKGIKGLASSEDRTQYQLAFRTRPAHQFIDFVQGLGITRFVYGHHGTISETDLKLVEVHLEK